MTKQHTPNRFLERVKLKLHAVTVPLICKIAIPLRDACLFGAHTYIYSNMTKYMVVEDYFMSHIKLVGFQYPLRENIEIFFSNHSRRFF